MRSRIAVRVLFIAPLVMSGVAEATSDAPTSADTGLARPSAASPANSASEVTGLRPRAGAPLAFLGAEPTFLSPDVAFRLSTRLGEDGKVVARWDIADGYYMYRARFGAAVSESPGFELVRATLPPGIVREDPYFGEVEVYYGGVEYELEVQRMTDVARSFSLELRYQGCADAGLCYPPITVQLPIEVPEANASRGPFGP